MHAWESFVNAQEQEIGSATVEKWLKSLKVVRFDAGNLYLEAKDAFQVMWFEEHMQHKVAKALFNNNKRKIKVHLTVVDGAVKAVKALEKGKKQQETKPSFSLVLDELDPFSTLDHFIVSEQNLLTYKIFSQVLEEKNIEKLIFNPLYLHAPSGAGKTHLLMGTAAALRKQNKKVVFARAQTFADHVVSAIRAGEMGIFRESYRNTDVLIIDDVHIFSRKGATQEEFFHTFNSLHLAGKQIIFSANCPPKELQFIEPRLISRFEWGIVVSLERPSREDAEKILTVKLNTLDFPLHKKVIDFLLDSFTTMTSLNKALEALILRAHLDLKKGRLSSMQLTVAFLEQELADLIAEEQQSKITPQRIVHDVAQYFGIKSDDVLGDGQTRDRVLPRQLSMYLCRQELKMPYMKIKITNQLVTTKNILCVNKSIKIEKLIGEQHFQYMFTGA